VRSSGTAEDLADASFAGQYVTVLGVPGPDAVLDAVRQRWASAFGDRVRMYRTSRGEHGVPAMAVLVQRMVAADAAGVAFTANPVTGDRSETIVSAVRGLGERLVSGETSPDEWIVAGGRATQRSIDVPTQVSAGTRALQEVALGLLDDQRAPLCAGCCRDGSADGEEKLAELAEVMRRALRL
jgi:pyruvate,water dikinase